MQQHGTCSATVDFPRCHGPDNHLEADHEDPNPAAVNVQKKHRWVLGGQVVCRRVERLKRAMFAKSPRGMKCAHEFLAVCQLPCFFLAPHVLMKQVCHTFVDPLAKRSVATNLAEHVLVLIVAH